jgi:hypothetical protein
MPLGCNKPAEKDVKKPVKLSGVDSSIKYASCQRDVDFRCLGPVTIFLGSPTSPIISLEDSSYDKSGVMVHDWGSRCLEATGSGVISGKKLKMGTRLFPSTCTNSISLYDRINSSLFFR